MENSDAVQHDEELDTAEHRDASASAVREPAWFTHPTYAAKFRCIGPDCEDPCCNDWDIPLDRATYERYRHFPREGLGAIVSEFVLPSTPPQPDELYAQIHRAPSGKCPFLGTDRLCGIQKEYGPNLLSSTCSIYPRSLNRIGELLEGSLILSCPEAAREILLNPDFMESGGDLFSGEFRTDNRLRLDSDATGSPGKPESAFLAIRGLLIELIKDRSRPIGHRLLVVGQLCAGLEAIPIGSEDRRYQSFLADFQRMRDEPYFDAELDNLPSKPDIRLQIVFELTNQVIQGGARSRFQETFWGFVEGIGSPVESHSEEPADDLSRFLTAEKTYHQSYFETHPFVLENYLINYSIQHLFPYGRVGSPEMSPQSISTEYFKMTTLFAWMNALLIGNAGRYKDHFSGEHVVHVIQSFTRTVEHSPPLLASLTAYIKARGLDSLSGMAILLRSSASR
jgi:lysine-N-methylase